MGRYKADTMKVYLISLVLILYCCCASAKVVTNILEPVRNKVSIEQLKDMGIIISSARSKSDTELGWLAFDITQVVKKGKFSFAKILLFNRERLVVSLVADEVTMDKRSYVTSNFNSYIIDSVVVEFWFGTEVVYEVKVSGKAL